MINVSSFINLLQRMAGLKLQLQNSKTLLMLRSGQRDVLSQLEDDILGYGNGKKIRYVLIQLVLTKCSGEVFVLSNRSVLYSHLGDDAEFYAAVSMECDSVVVASRSGFIYQLNAGTREIKFVIDIGREITCMNWDKAQGLVWIGGENGSLGLCSFNSC